MQSTSHGNTTAKYADDTNIVFFRLGSASFGKKIKNILNKGANAGLKVRKMLVNGRKCESI